MREKFAVCSKKKSLKMKGSKNEDHHANDIKKQKKSVYFAKTFLEKYKSKLYEMINCKIFKQKIEVDLLERE